MTPRDGLPSLPDKGGFIPLDHKDDQVNWIERREMRSRYPSKSVVQTSLNEGFGLLATVEDRQAAVPEHEGDHRINDWASSGSFRRART